jgi:hypothetical protein
MKMKTIRNSILCLTAVLLGATFLQGQELSKYRGFSLGTSLADVLKLSGQKLADVKTLHARPALIQELSWWPGSSPGASARPDSVEEILFSFSDGELYKMSVTYERASTQGLTVEDMVRSISEKYGPPTNVEPEIEVALNKGYDAKPSPVAAWQDSQYSFELVRASYTDRLGLSIYSKAANAAAELSIAQAVTLEEQERPEKEASQKKRDADDLEVTREKNQKSFRP